MSAKVYIVCLFVFLIPVVVSEMGWVPKNQAEPGASGRSVCHTVHSQDTKRKNNCLGMAGTEDMDRNLGLIPLLRHSGAEAGRWCFRNPSTSDALCASCLIIHCAGWSQGYLSCLLAWTKTLVCSPMVWRSAPPPRELSTLFLFGATSKRRLCVCEQPSVTFSLLFFEWVCTELCYPINSRALHCAVCRASGEGGLDCNEITEWVELAR